MRQLENTLIQKNWHNITRLRRPKNTRMTILMRDECMTSGEARWEMGRGLLTFFHLPRETNNNHVENEQIKEEKQEWFCP